MASTTEHSLRLRQKSVGNLLFASTRLLPSSVRQAWRAALTDACLIMIGSILFIIGLKSILVQHQLIAGGLTGAAILLHHIQPLLDIGWWYLILNLPLAWLGWHRIGKRFMILTIFGMVFFSVAAVWINPPAIAISEPILAVLAAGGLCGLGTGIILRSKGSAGGLDILSVYLKEKFGFSVGAVGFVLNAFLLVAGAWFYNLEAALYSALFLFVCGRIVDAVIVGINPQMVLLVISDHSEQIGQDLLRSSSCGITFLKGEGGVNRNEKKVIYSVARKIDIPKLRTRVLQIDPTALVIVNEVSEVTGRKTFGGISRSTDSAGVPE
jgi:uncharacterized membrane-anchored protein YitT (DUF2179 family)